MAARIAAFLAVAGAGLVLAPTPAVALTRTQANAKALAALKPEKLHGPTGVVVYGTTHALHAGKWVWALSVPKGKRHRRTVKRKPLKSDAWLFWMDPQWGAEFSHPSPMLLIDDATGKVV